MSLQVETEESRSLIIAGIDVLLKQRVLETGKMPKPALIPFSYPGTGELCYVWTSPVGYIAVLYAVSVRFRRLEREIGNLNLARALFSMHGPRGIDYARGCALATFRPAMDGDFALVTVVEAQGSGNAAAEIGRKRLIPPAGWRVESGVEVGAIHTHEGFNVGASVNFDEGVGHWTDCDDNHAVVSDMTAEEIAEYAKALPISQDEHAALYYTAQARKVG